MSNRLTIKGQVTIPKNVRDFLGLTMGSSAVEFYIDADGSVKVRKAAGKSRVRATGQVQAKACSRQETARSPCFRATTFKLPVSVVGGGCRSPSDFLSILTQSGWG